MARVKENRVLTITNERHINVDVAVSVDGNAGKDDIDKLIIEDLYVENARTGLQVFAVPHIEIRGYHFRPGTRNVGPKFSRAILFGNREYPSLRIGQAFLEDILVEEISDPSGQYSVINHDCIQWELTGSDPHYIKNSTLLGASDSCMDIKPGATVVADNCTFGTGNRPIRVWDGAIYYHRDVKYLDNGPRASIWQENPSKALSQVIPFMAGPDHEFLKKC